MDNTHRWLAQLKTLIQSLDLLDVEALPPSFKLDILGPVGEGAGCIEDLARQASRLALIRDLAGIHRAAEGKTWFFWEKTTRTLADFVRAEHATVYRHGPHNALHKVHPLQSEEDLDEETWPQDQEDAVAKVREEGFEQTFFLKLGLHEPHPLVIKFQRQAPFPLIQGTHLAELLDLSLVLFKLVSDYFPKKERGKNLEIITGPTEEGEKTGILGKDPGFLRALKAVEQAAQSDASVYLKGESGTGKELFAKRLHRLSTRGDAPFVPINCSAIPHELIESEMFGHEKGAFTGAYYRKIGKVEQAHGGTLFLDEIGEMPLPFQAKLLRYLQEKKFTRVGGNTAHFSDSRIVVATHRDLKDMVAHGAFREDLYYRIHVIPITIPPLRERGSDIRHLSYLFFQKYITKSRASRRKVDEAVFDALEHYTYPGNVRELENLIQRTVVMTQNPIIHLEDLPDEVFKTREDRDQADFRLHPFEKFDGFVPDDREVLKTLKKEVERVAFSYQRDLDRRFLLHLLAKNQGSARKAAEQASINRTLFYKLLKRVGLDINLLNKEEP